MRSKLDIIRIGDFSELIFARFDQDDLRFGRGGWGGGDDNSLHHFTNFGGLGGGGGRCGRTAGREYVARDRRRDQERFEIVVQHGILSLLALCAELMV